MVATLSEIGRKTFFFNYIELTCLKKMLASSFHKNWARGTKSSFIEFADPPFRLSVPLLLEKREESTTSLMCCRGLVSSEKNQRIL